MELITLTQELLHFARINHLQYLLTWTDTNECDFTASKYVIMHAMNENTPYPGMVVQYGPSGIISEYRQGSNSIFLLTLLED